MLWIAVALAAGISVGNLLPLILILARFVGMRWRDGGLLTYGIYLVLVARSLIINEGDVMRLAHGFIFTISSIFSLKEVMAPDYLKYESKTVGAVILFAMMGAIFWPILVLPEVLLLSRTKFPDLKRLLPSLVVSIVTVALAMLTSVTGNYWSLEFEGVMIAGVFLIYGAILARKVNKVDLGPSEELEE